MKKIYLIIIIGLTLRLIHIDAPLLGYHAWRQADTASVARNFYMNGFNLFYPQINWSPESTGYVESEFQIYPYVISILYYLFGENDIYGRILSLIFSLFTIYGLFLLVKRIENEETALWTSFIYAILPLNVYYGRAFMPESALMMCSVFAVYYFYMWTDIGKNKFLWIAGIFTCLAILLKIPTLYIGLPLCYLAYQKTGWGFLKEKKLWFFTFLIFLPVVLWYYHAHQLYVNNGASYNIWGFGSDKWGNLNLLIDFKFYKTVFVDSIAERWLTYPGFILMLFGLFLKVSSKYEKIFYYWFIAVSIYILIVAQGNKTHEYYQFPLMLPVCFFIGKSLNKLLPLNRILESFKNHKFKSACIVIIIIMIFILSYSRMISYWKAENSNSVILRIASDVKTVSNEKDYIMVVSDGDPVYLYHFNRIGWNPTAEMLDTNFMKEKIHNGAKWLAGEKNKFKSEESIINLKYITDKYQTVINKDEYYIFKLQ
jgi:4-amino-4-deoxy-L-arabinose transferase-like glycosyltransferase